MSARAIESVRGRGQRNGQAAGCQERQRQKERKVQRQTPRLREGDTDRQTDAHARARTCARTHTHTGRQRQREGDTERVTERQQTGDRQGREDGIGSETDTLAQPVTHLRGRRAEEAASPREGASALGRPRLDTVPWVWQSPVGTPRLPQSLGLKGPLRPGYLR